LTQNKKKQKKTFFTDSQMNASSLLARLLEEISGIDASLLVVLANGVKKTQIHALAAQIQNLHLGIFRKHYGGPKGLFGEINLHLHPDWRG
jgi:hypothetical protein